jgi:hypothetical protein
MSARMTPLTCCALPQRAIMTVCAGPCSDPASSYQTSATSTRAAASVHRAVIVAAESQIARGGYATIHTPRWLSCVLTSSNRRVGGLIRGSIV